MIKIGSSFCDEPLWNACKDSMGVRHDNILTFASILDGIFKPDPGQT